MSALQSRAVLRATRALPKLQSPASTRCIASTPSRFAAPPPPPSSNDATRIASALAEDAHPQAHAPAAAAALSTKKGKKGLSPIPLRSPSPIFPAPNNPFDPPAPAAPKQYSETTKTLVRGLAKLMGYNSRASTTIRETRRMMGGIVQAIDKDRSFWYTATYQIFFQLHLLYILVLLPRLRALPAITPTTTHPIPESPTPDAPRHQQSLEEANKPDSKPLSILTKANYEAYPGELIDHFFELAESQMRIVLGQGERERVIQKYMSEMAEQWKGGGVGLDYVLALSMSEVPEERARSDEELASWVWRNLFQGKGLTATPLPGAPANPSLAGGEGAAAVDPVKIHDLDMASQIAQVVTFVRREMARLDRVSDADVLAGNIGAWGSPRDE